MVSSQFTTDEMLEGDEPTTSRTIRTTRKIYSGCNWMEPMGSPAGNDFMLSHKKNSHGRLSGHQVSFLQYLLSLASNVLLVNLLIAMLTLFLW